MRKTNWSGMEFETKVVEQKEREVHSRLRRRNMEIRKRKSKKQED